MNKNGEIIIVEDDVDDQDLLRQVIREIGVPNQVTILSDGAEAYDYFNNKNKDPFLIISDVNMPRMNGLELRDMMQQQGEVRLRTIPFIFMTTGTTETTVATYAPLVQGFFTKPTNYLQLKETVNAILGYWTKTTRPKLAM
ncbi:MAG: response regulator [Sphingobacteriales bacterium]|nr:MAG: response regulator [Sphingobacteriales bacterium]